MPPLRSRGALLRDLPGSPITELGVPSDVIFPHSMQILAVGPISLSAYVTAA
jgi:hypothetical protein